MVATRWARVCSLPAAELVLLAEAAVLVSAFDLALRVLSPRTCLAFLARKKVSHRSRAGPVAQRLAWLVGVADRYAAGRSSCLRRAAALSWLLRRRGIGARLLIGVARQEDGIVAHAWLESKKGETLGLAEGDGYAVLSRPVPSVSLHGRDTRGTGHRERHRAGSTNVMTHRGGE